MADNDKKNIWDTEEELLKPAIRITTGSETLDELLHGGLPEKKSYLIAGEPGTGKTTLSLAYIMEGLKNDEVCVYVALDERPKHIIQDAANLGWNLIPYIKDKKLLIMDLSYSLMTDKEQQDKVNVDKLLTELKHRVSTYNAKRLVVDPIAPVVLTADNESEARSYIKSLIFGIDELLGTTTLFTSHIAPGSEGLSQYGIEEFVVSGIIKLMLRKIGNTYVRTLFIRKMRSTKTELVEYVFDIIPSKGIVIRQAI